MIYKVSEYALLQAPSPVTPHRDLPDPPGSTPPPSSTPTPPPSQQGEGGGSNVKQLIAKMGGADNSPPPPLPRRKSQVSGIRVTMDDYLIWELYFIRGL